MPSTVEITSLAYGGNGVGRIDGKVVFVPFTAPGDVAEVEMTSEKKDFGFATLTGLKTPSPLRQTPPCPVFTLCGGCQWQHIGYPHQVEWKNIIFSETLKRLAGVTPPLTPPVPSPKPYNYRSRSRFHTDGERWGFFEARTHDVVDIEGCPLLEPVINTTFKGIKNAALPKTLYSFEIARDSEKEKTVAAFFMKTPAAFDWAGALSKVKELKGYEVWVKDPFKRGKGRLMEREGEEDISYCADGLHFSAAAGSFSQVNIPQNTNLVENVIEFSALTGKEDILDIFCGAGNLTLPLGKRAKKTVGIDSDPRSIGYGRRNAEKNKITSVEFACESAARSKALENIRPSVVILDPPRGGSLEVVRKIAGLKIKRVIYVSCNPPAMARDISILLKGGYTLFSAVTIDMFPQTYHIEAIAGLGRVSLKGRLG
ncbi:MAG: class I SAM-dependent RNA methyltransferase [Deltaproteobacteria bacterium]|nr:class I SAM-dependent RNA methyltransferase [Deltaproteobacteria bacterium]